MPEAEPNSQTLVFEIRANDVFLDIRNGSPTYGLHGTRKLNADDNNAIFIPEGFAHGFVTLSKQSIVVYL